MPAATRWRSLVVLLACAGAAVVVLTASVRNTFSDPRGSMLVAEQILRNQSLALDSYGSDITHGYQFYEWAGHTFYLFPIGTPIVSIPFVAALLAVGGSLPEDEAGLQVVIAALTAAITVYLSYRVARMFIGYAAALGLSIVFWLGTMLSSTGGTALWSSNWAVVFSLTALLALARISLGRLDWTWAVLGGSLVLAYLSRPTLSVLAVFAIGYAVVKAPRTGLLAGGLLAGGLALFAGASLYALGMVLPFYYRPGRLSPDTLLDALAGNLWSPSRGLLVFVPLLVAIPLLAVLTPANLRRHAGLLVVALGWPAVHVIAASGLPHWWGGHSYGPRLMTEALPGLFLAIVLLWPPDWRSTRARAVAVVLVVAAAASIWIHSVQGLHNSWTREWNVRPNVDRYPETIWDWRYPQFLHSEERYEERVADYGLVPPAEG